MPECDFLPPGFKRTVCLRPGEGSLFPAKIFHPNEGILKGKLAGLEGIYPAPERIIDAHRAVAVLKMMQGSREQRA